MSNTIDKKQHGPFSALSAYFGTKRASTCIPLLLLFLLLPLASCEKYDEYLCPSNGQYGTTALITGEKAGRIYQAVCNSVNANKLIGIQVSIRDSLNEDWSIAFGSTDLKQSKTMQHHDILRIGSVTKIYTATLILKLIEQGHLQPEQKIAGFFPGYNNVQDVTIRNLMNHSSGITDVFSIPSIFTSASHFPDKQWDPNHLAGVCMDKRLRFSPGTRHEYSNTNFILLGIIAEQATGKKTPELFEELIFNPLDLRSTYLVPYQGTPPALVNGYVHHFALSMKQWYTTEPGNTAWATIAFTAGAMATNATDLSAFMHHLFRGDIIDQQSLELMTTFSGDRGLGLNRINVNDRIYWGHEGEITGFESIAAYDPETGIVISICSNTTPYQINDLLDAIDAEL
jgi:D-alanyl-D-alanine carboxypeptidase